MERIWLVPVLAGILILGTLGLSHNAYAAFLTPVEIMDATGDGSGNPLDGSFFIAVDSLDNVFVSGSPSNNAFKITPAGVITEIIDSTGDGAGNTLLGATGVAIDSLNNVFVAGRFSDNVFKITPAGVITKIIDSTGDGAGNALDNPFAIAVDSSDNIFVVAENSDNAFKITPAGVITEIIDSTGDGAGNPFITGIGVATDSSGNVFVGARDSGGFTVGNAFKISTPGTCSTSGPLCIITEIIDTTGDGAGNTLLGAQGVTTDSSDNVFVAAVISDNVFKIDTPGACSTSGPLCTITEIIDATGDGAGNILDLPQDITTDSSGNVYVAGFDSSNAFQITPGGVITEIIDSTGDGAGNPLSLVFGIEIDSSGNVFVAGLGSDNVFKIDVTGPPFNPVPVATGTVPTTCCGIDDIAIDSSGTGSDGTVYAAQFADGVSKFTTFPTGLSSLPVALFRPVSVAVDSSGDVYV